MFPPVDYPLKASQEDAADAADITYAALLDRYDSEQPITNDMIQKACQKMDEAQQFPFAPVEAAADELPAQSSKTPAAIPRTTLIATPITTASGALLGRFKNIIR